MELNVEKKAIICYNFISIGDYVMDNMQKNNKRVFIMILSIALVIISGTFAWLSWRSQNTAMVLTIGDIRGLTVSLKPYQINATLSPVSAYTDGIVIDVTADNKKTEADNFKLFYKIDTIDNALKDQSFKYTITKCTANCANASNYTLLNAAGGNFVGANNNSNLPIYQESVPANTTYKYKVYLWIDSSGGNQSNMQNKTFTGELRASVSETLYTMMRDNAVIDNTTSTYVTNSNGVQFNAISSDTNGKGLYIRAGTENDAHPILYYRGAVDNNNVLFAGFCWKIVRTTSSGGTKLIYNGLPSGTNSDQCTNTTGTDTQIGTSAFNSNYTSPADVGYMYGTRYTSQSKAMTSISDTYMYGTSYDENTHKLVTTNAMNFAGTDWATYYNQLNNNHYTCFNTSGECNQVYYIYHTSNSRAYYVTIPSGKTISQMLDEMLTSSSNANDSTIKTAIDTWYANNMTSYTSKLEDTPYCNDRTIYQLNGWSPTGSTTSYLYLSPYGRANSTYTPSLTCNTNDAFTVSASNGNGKLTYPVGLLTADEIRLAGGKYGSNNSTYYLYTNQNWWSGSPFYFYFSALEFFVNSSGYLDSNNVNLAYGVRPAVSLKPGAKFLSGGDGTSTNPYVVE